MCEMKKLANEDAYIIIELQGMSDAIIEDADKGLLTLMVPQIWRSKIYRRQGK